ncbi:heavy-metal-associated domain-containing protein [Adhaeribacter soli]|uniref:Heavy-metal-associated domain-containing protein n=1 Tax=Adhaeribacter soli TaxID=2607655 RepID=A0A5N1J9Z7_9BACT|nr:heavy-metal-associated domain-containing protein [Adhaeribacter soli]KAA9345659.1 heavy-metal-associated domain-containing protein [Adhaeribacter soli]
MKKLHFKTNINCGGCLKAVTPTLNQTEGIKCWQVDTENPEKIMTVETETLTEKEVIAAVEKAGFKASAL